MLKLDDIFALAKQGYKPSDIKELIELSKEAEVTKESDSSTQEENNNDETPSHENTVAPEDEKQTKEAEDSKIVDYKKKVEELEKTISDLQKANTRKNVADTDTPSDSEVVADLFKSFM